MARNDGSVRSFPFHVPTQILDGVLALCFTKCKYFAGNYYSLHDQHEKAVTYFQRALKLNPQYTSAWTLMGHEFMERKNTSAAIEAYRKAIGNSCCNRPSCFPVLSSLKLSQHDNLIFIFFISFNY